MLRVASPPCMHAAMLCKTKTHIFFLSFFKVNLQRSRITYKNASLQKRRRPPRQLINGARARSPAGMLAEAATKTSRSSSGLGRVQSTLDSAQSARHGAGALTCMPCRAAAPDRGRAVPVRPRDMTASSSSPTHPPRARNDPPALPPVHVPVRPRATLPSAAGQVTRRERRPHGPTSRGPLGVPRAARRDGPASRSSSTCVPARARPRVNVRGPRETPPPAADRIERWSTRAGADGGARPCRARAACARQSFGLWICATPKQF
jgi:hypothetical protein